MYYNKCKQSLAVIHLTINIFFLQLPGFTCYFHCSIISYHFIHSLLMTYFTSNYCYTLKIACVCCIFACSYSLSHPFSFTIITHVGGSNGVDMMRLMKHWLPFLNNTNPIKIPENPVNKRALGWNLLPPKVYFLLLLFDWTKSWMCFSFEKQNFTLTTFF